MPEPWYTIVEGDEIEQGDILVECPVPVIDYDSVASGADQIGAEIKQMNLVVVSQSCDLVKGREKIDSVVLCPVAPVGTWDFSGASKSKKR